MLHKCASVSVGSSTVNGIHTSIGHGLLDRNGRCVACGDTVRLVLSGLMCVRMAEWWHKNNTHGQVRNASSVPLDCQKVRQYSGFGMSGKTCPASYVSGAVSQSVDLGQNNNPNTTPTKDYENVQVVVYLHGVQRGCAEEGEWGSTPTG